MIELKSTEHFLLFVEIKIKTKIIYFCNFKVIKDYNYWYNKMSISVREDVILKYYLIV